MNEHKKPRGHKAHNDKDSILADAKNLLHILYPAIQRMPKIERIEGAPVEMKKAAQNIIRHFSIAKECQEVRQERIREMFGEFGSRGVSPEYMNTINFLRSRNTENSTVLFRP